MPSAKCGWIMLHQCLVAGVTWKKKKNDRKISFIKIFYKYPECQLYWQSSASGEIVDQFSLHQRKDVPRHNMFVTANWWISGQWSNKRYRQKIEILSKCGGMKLWRQSITYCWKKKSLYLSFCVYKSSSLPATSCHKQKVAANEKLTVHRKLTDLC